MTIFLFSAARSAYFAFEILDVAVDSVCCGAWQAVKINGKAIAIAIMIFFIRCSIFVLKSHHIELIEADLIVKIHLDL